MLSLFSTLHKLGLCLGLMATILSARVTEGEGMCVHVVDVLFVVFNLFIFPKLRNTSSLNAATVVTPGSNYFRKLAKVPLLNKLR